MVRIKIEGGEYMPKHNTIKKLMTKIKPSKPSKPTRGNRTATNTKRVKGNGKKY